MNRVTRVLDDIIRVRISMKKGHGQYEEHRLMRLYEEFEQALKEANIDAINSHGSPTQV